MSTGVLEKGVSGSHTSPIREKRLDIQGLRALAVMLVVIYHLWPKRLTGGFIGVDVFFVISGYLITAHLVSEVARAGTVSLSHFWSRRIRRLLPAAFLVLAVSTVLAVTVAPETLLKQNLQEIGAATVYGLNWLLSANAVDYLAADNAPSIVQHYWSLSVEEQFYIVWPVLVVIAAWLASRSRRQSPRRLIFVMFAVVFLVSLTLSIWLTQTSPESAYFVTHTRAWEFAAGGLIAFLPAALMRRLPDHAATFASWLALFSIVAPGFLYTAKTPFPGWTALIPVIGTAALIAIGDRNSPWSPQYLARAGFVQFLGDKSYSIYLWHWPLIIAGEALIGRALGAKWGIAVFVLTIALAFLTSRYVEEPFRSSKGLLRHRRTSYAFMAAGMVLIVGAVSVLGWVFRSDTEKLETSIADSTGCFGFYALENDCDDPYAVTDTVDPAFSSQDQYWTAAPLWDHGCFTKMFDSAEPCEIGETESPTATIALIGDSHAEQFVQTIGEVAVLNGWRVLVYARSSCSGFESETALDQVTSKRAQFEGCIAWGAKVREDVLNRGDVDLALLTSRERTKFVTVAEGRTSLALFDEAEIPVAVITDPQGMRDDVKAPVCVEAQIAAGIVTDPCPQELSTKVPFMTQAAKESGVPVIDIASEISRGDVVHTVIGGTLVYFDSNHLAVTFARTLVPWFDEKLKSLDVMPKQ